ncbi:MAG: GIY-YIG nuclease family protein [Xanthobacteraceae bacterium]
MVGVLYYVYLMANRKHGTLYIGVTNNLIRRAYEHRTNAVRGFTSRYHVHLLVWFEGYDDPLTAITREKEIKKWRRAWKVNLIEQSNPEWADLFESLAS